jgi:hypothetical protein
MIKELKTVIIFFTIISMAFHLEAQDVMNVNILFYSEHGFFEDSTKAAIISDVQDCKIHYTLNGSVPKQTVGQATFLYTGPIDIYKTTCIRAIAISPDNSISNVATRTCINLNDVIQQNYQATINAGFPNKWGSVTPDYGLDPDIINDAVYGPLMKSSLLSIPSMSIVMDIDDLFASYGIYTNSTERGANWERPASVELIFPDNTEGFQVNCGIRIQGGAFRDHSLTLKHSFSFLFKSEYGPTKLRYPLFGEDAADRFDILVLRAGANDGYAWDAARYTEQYTRDEYARLLQSATGNISAHGIFVHLYINGIYWGLYNAVERPDNSFSAIYLGGDKDTWDAFDSDGIIEGNSSAWNLLISKCQSGLESYETYMEIQGKNPEGTRNPDFPILIDIQNYIDYMIVNMWAGNWDWPWKNYRYARDRSEASTGFKFYCWDTENIMGNNRERSPLNMDKITGDNTTGIGQLHGYLLNSPEYRMLFADRVHKFFYDGGVLMPLNLIDLYTELASQVELPIIAESARWGDTHHSTPLTQQDWYNERDWILNEYILQRNDIVMDQFKVANLYSNIDAPVFYVNNIYQHGGEIESTDSISLTSAEGKIYYTFNGSDPRLPSTSDVKGTILIPEDHDKKVLVPQSDIGDQWITDTSYNDSDWVSCLGSPGGVGYERSSGYESYITLDVENDMYDKNGTCYIRIPFEIKAGILDSLTSLTLRIRYDDGFVAYLNGSEVARENFTGTPAWNSNATSENNDASAITFKNINISSNISLLNKGKNLLAVQGLNRSITSSDLLISFELIGSVGNSNPEATPSAIEYLLPFTLSTTTRIKSRVFSNAQWSALSEANFYIYSNLKNLIISELHYHPLPLDGIDEREFEFIRLKNAGAATLNLSLARFIKGVTYEFPVNTLLDPGQDIILASSKYYFYICYGFYPFDSYTGELDNGGEQIILVDYVGDTLISFRYNDKDPWPVSADGDGYSLVFIGTGTNPDYNNAHNWQASDSIYGTPSNIDLIKDNLVLSIPQEFDLLQNYPNPFNSRTIIPFTVSKNSFVSITVYDITGQKLETLVNKEFTPGQHTIEWDANNRPNGVYLVQMSTGSFKRTIKLVLLRF